jgi:hypothetical protein
LLGSQCFPSDRSFAASPLANFLEHAVPKNKQIEVQLDRRSKSERRGADRRKADIPVAVERRQGERRAKVPRRRQIDPTTCERDYSGDEIEFMHALDAYKRANGRMFPTCSEILEVIRGLGYVRLAQGERSTEQYSPPVPAAETLVDDGEDEADDFE